MYTLYSKRGVIEAYARAFATAVIAAVCYGALNAVSPPVAAVVVDFVPDLLLRPYVSGRNLHLGLVVLSYVFGPLLWGWYGLFLGLLVLVLLVHFVRLVLPELVASRRIEPQTVVAVTRNSSGISGTARKKMVLSKTTHESYREVNTEELAEDIESVRYGGE